MYGYYVFNFEVYFGLFVFEFVKKFDDFGMCCFEVFFW